MGRGEDIAVIVGAGQAGARAAKAMRDAGFEGRIRMFGAEAHPPYERPLLSKSLLQSAATTIPFMFAAEAYDEMAIEFLPNMRVTAIDRGRKSVALHDGSSAQYDKLLIATGSLARPLAIPGYPQERILSLRTLDDCAAIRDRLASRPPVAVVGGGFIGLEVAATMAGQGCSVVVLEAADHLLPRLGCRAASDMVLAHHRAAGIDVRLSARVTGGGSDHILLADGCQVEAAFVVAGIGIVPATELAEAAGLEVADGILVDAFGQSSDPSIFAAGDVTRHFNPRLGRHIRLESWQNANLQAETAGRAMAGERVPHDAVPWLWSDQGSLNLQMAGAPDAVDRSIIRGRPGSEEGITVFQFSGDTLVGGLTVNRGKEMPLVRRMLSEGFFGAPDSLADDATPLRKILTSKATK